MKEYIRINKQHIEKRRDDEIDDIKKTFSNHVALKEQFYDSLLSAIKDEIDLLDEELADAKQQLKTSGLKRDEVNHNIKALEGQLVMKK